MFLFSDFLSKIPLHEGMKVADFGSGSALMTVEVARAVAPTGRVYAVEVQKDLIGRIKKEAESARVGSIVEPIWGNVENLGGTKIKDEICDAVLICNTFFMLEDKKGAIKESARVLKKGGFIFLLEWEARPVNAIKREQARSYFAGSPFEEVNFFDLGDSNYVLVLRKK
ncbi:MAG: methyltransferase domain-containing protein [Candidatus Pacebacteria bacterium]|jgi:ubiquinone/menaquinone biosynthesis C-methylase UbiE|nr:methyltransferase domain-containing protein [Candidatus Paceibacterota bacterium]MBP9058091.1 methyltransferase domain-containing protein [Candidatus Paceibacterota bacterium]MBP9769985.1 methyltransferase domain-containing protein [Candidatus Paceibacterota bacterium]